MKTSVGKIILGLLVTVAAATAQAQQQSDIERISVGNSVWLVPMNNTIAGFRGFENIGNEGTLHNRWNTTNTALFNQLSGSESESVDLVAEKRSGSQVTLLVATRDLLVESLRSSPFRYRRETINRTYQTSDIEIPGADGFRCFAESMYDGLGVQRQVGDVLVRSGEVFALATHSLWVGQSSFYRLEMTSAGRGDFVSLNCYSSRNGITRQSTVRELRAAAEGAFQIIP